LTDTFTFSLALSYCANTPPSFDYTLSKLSVFYSVGDTFASATFPSATDAEDDLLTPSLKYTGSVTDAPFFYDYTATNLRFLIGLVSQKVNQVTYSLVDYDYCGTGTNTISMDLELTFV